PRSNERCRAKGHRRRARRRRGQPNEGRCAPRHAASHARSQTYAISTDGRESRTWWCSAKMKERWLCLSLIVASVAVTMAHPAHAECAGQAAVSFYADARRAFEEPRYDRSGELLRQAYACDKNPMYLHNIARAYEESQRPKEALAAWQAYYAAVTDEHERA